MALEDQLRSLDLSNESKRQGSKDVLLYFKDNETLKLSTSESFMDLSEVEAAFQRLFKINKLNDSKIEAANDIDTEIKALVGKVKLSPINYKTAAEDEVKNKELKDFSQTIALLAANFTVNDFIKTEIDESLIEKMTMVYIEILNLLKNYNFSSPNFLLTRVSLISPLLITISFSYKLRSPTSSSLMNILSILFTYSIKNPDILQSVIKLFAITPTTNIEMFEVFNKLWESTLENSTGNQLNDRQLPGPISISNRISHLQGYEISTTLLNTIFPYSQNQYIRQLSRNTLKIHSILTNIKAGNKISKHLTELVSFTSDNCTAETLAILLQTLNLQDTFLDLFGDENFTNQLGYIFSKLSQTSIPIGRQPLLNKLQKSVLDKDILSPFETSLNMRYKVLIEIIDHNTAIDFQKEASWSISLMNSLYLIKSDFDLVKSHMALSDLGSSLSLPAIIIKVSFILSDAILKIVNPSREISTHLKQNITFNNLPPLPISDFLDFSNVFISQSQVNLGNLQRLLDSLHYCSSILNDIHMKYNEFKEFIHPVQNLEGKDDDLEFQATDKYLLLNYSSLFSTLTLADELSQKSKGYGDLGYSSVFFDLSSIGKTLQLQVFKVFESIFKLYDTFAFFKLIKLIMKISMNDLELQKFSIKLLNHLVFHSGNGLKIKIENNELIMRLLTQFVSLWSDNSNEYIRFERFLNIPTTTSNDSVIFDTKYYLNVLGYDDHEILPMASPATATSTHSSSDSYSFTSNNTNNGFNISNNSQSIPTPGTLNNSTFTKQPTLQDTSYFNNPNYNYSTNQQFNNNNNNFNQFQNTNGPLSTGAMDYGYRTSNIRNVQSFIPQTFVGQNQNIRSQSVHVDQYSNFE
ncbi:hypothetical protein BN7_5287 [Wickerhamomyces ciferrii]|uniref:Uncharacterized protein n=1 Tax=Wickerhamomyces ciferrii (strain ATCC 14091 / BCRC 22168 / CBS 111 / JCM 3599 / NBRC 0793 / NRRL Y-1031 F-60-10) TaxID=1206466 RepID=K0KUW7_WICCF|nr:uncharacterized protein BN7_5287 [Wickerhamomyces ciferrii]CCH45702.1 hypothetical protein BN7_5287 [Wickerhamomyces ciferrii]